MEWREGNNTDVSSLFYVSNLQMPSANLTMYGENFRQAGSGRFKALYLDWKVNTLEDFKELLPAAQCHLGFPKPRSVQNSAPVGQVEGRYISH